MDKPETTIAEASAAHEHAMQRNAEAKPAMTFAEAADAYLADLKRPMREDALARLTAIKAICAAYNARGRSAPDAAMDTLCEVMGMTRTPEQETKPVQNILTVADVRQAAREDRTLAVGTIIESGLEPPAPQHLMVTNIMRVAATTGPRWEYEMRPVTVAPPADA